MVYQPQPEHIPAYEEYADPAAAHGWQNTYDETRELPPVVAPGPRRSRRKPSPWRQRRAAGVAVAVGAVSAAALIAGFSSSDRGAQSEKGRTSPTAADPGSGTPSDTAPGTTRDTATSAPPTAGGARTTPGSSPSPSATASDAGTPEPSADEPSASPPRASEPSGTAAPSTAPALVSAPTVTPAPDDGRGNANGNPGHGQGGTKGPK